MLPCRSELFAQAASEWVVPKSIPIKIGDLVENFSADRVHRARGVSVLDEMGG